MVQVGQLQFEILPSESGFSLKIWLLARNGIVGTVSAEDLRGLIRYLTVFLEKSAPEKRPSAALVNEIINAGVRARAKVHHPDVGGGAEAMKEINLAADFIRSKSLGQIERTSK